MGLIKAIFGARLGALSMNKKTSTNPFENVNFKGKSFTGSVLPFADVFQLKNAPKSDILSKKQFTGESNARYLEPMARLQKGERRL